MVSLNFIGESEAVKEWAILEELAKEIEISVLPKDLVDHIDIDLTPLKEFDSNVKVSDIKVPSSIEILTPTEEVIVIAAKPKKVEEVETDAPEAPVTGADEEETEA
jgi:large subunit ribosomal protein L25